MKSKRFISLSILSVLSICLFSGAVTHKVVKENKDVLTTEAWDINVQPDVQESFYSTCDGKTGSDLKSTLASFNKPTNTSYDWSRYEAADEAQDDSTSIFCIYTRHNIKKSAHVGSYSWDTWNREHVYTQSAFPRSASDNHNIFACEGQINNTRGNLKYAEVKDNGGTRISEFGHTTDCYYIANTAFEPCDEAKGEVARACLYCSVYYGYDLNDIFDSINTCLKWNAMYTVSPREIYRNNIVQGLQGNRNPFVDHPSYAQAIYGGPAYQGLDPVGPQTPTAVSGVSLNETTATLDINDTLQLTATVSPSDATNKAVSWSSNNTSVAAVSNNGLVTAKAEGTATITVTTSDGGFTATCNITVNAPVIVPVLTSISLGGNYQTVFTLGDTFNYDGLVVTANYDIGASQVVNDYTVSQPNMSTAGNKIVRVTYQTVSATYSIRVDEPEPIHVESISLNAEDVRLNIGDMFQLEVTITPDDAADKSYYFDSSNPRVANISASGLVHAYSAGETIVSVTTVDGGHTATCTIKVVEKQAKKTGCFGSVTTTSAILSSLSVLGIGLLLIKRRKLDK